jgi:hypothetical protein
VARRGWLGIGAVAVVVLTTACGGSGLTVADLEQKVAPALGTTSGPCPISYDVAAAARSSGIAGDVALADTDPVSAEDGADPDSGDFVRKTEPALDVECDYRVGTTDVTTYLLATSASGSAIDGMAPEVTFLSGDEPDTFYPLLAAAQVGTAVPTPSGKAAVVRLEVQGGDGGLVVGVDPADGISSAQVADLAQALAAQIS